MRWALFLLRRIAARTAVAVWRHKFVWAAASLAASAFTVFGLSFGGPGAVSGDCADTAMAAVAHGDENAARAAYACLGPTMRTTSEDQFVAGMRQRAAPNGQYDRVADKRTSDGGRIVFYTVQSGQAPAVGYIVYLDPQGRITRVD